MTFGDGKKVSVKDLADLLTSQGVDLDDVGRIERVNAWQGFYKDGDDEAQVVDMSSISFVPKWESGPSWQPAERAAPVRVTPKKSGTVKGDGLTTLFLFPDTQIGFWRADDGSMVPMHDTGAMDVGLQAMEDVAPDAVGLAGDLVDFTDMTSKFRREPTVAQTTQASLDEAHRFLAVIRARTPEGCVIDLMEGNHDMRLTGYIVDNAKAAYGLRPAASLPDDWPSLSLPALLRLDELGVTYHDGFPAGQCWYREDLVMEHGKTINPKNLAKKTAVSRLMGHVHRLEAQSHTVQTGRDTVARALVLAFGTMSRVDGAVPSFGSGTDAHGMPVRNVEDWAQGFAVLTFDADDVGGPITYEIVPIHDNGAIFRGKRYRAGKWFDPVVPLPAVREAA